MSTNLLFPPRVTIEESNKAKYFEVLAPWLTFVPFMGSQIVLIEKRIEVIITRPNDEKQALSKERRATWLARIRRDDLSSNPSNFVRVCSDYFISGT